MGKPLYISAGLQISYMLFSIYGILRWNYKNKDRQSPLLLDAAGLSVSLIIILIALFNSNFKGIYDIIEIASVVLLITANLFTAREKVICWYFWIIGDITYAIFLFHESIYGMFIIEFIFLVLSFRGLYEWKKKSANSALS
jgi:Nicotinamide mononucleotide transporter